MRLVATLVAALALVGVAAAATAKEPKKDIIPAAQAKAKAMNVKMSDLPAAAGFKAKPASPDTGTPKCSFYNPDQSDLTENGDAKSPEFTLPSSSFVASSVSIFKTASQGRTAYSRVVQPKLPLCLAELFKKGAAPTKVTVVSAKQRAFPKLAERSIAYRVHASFKSNGRAFQVYFDIVAMNRAKVDAVIFFFGLGGSYNNSFEQKVAGVVAARTKNQ